MKRIILLALFLFLPASMGPSSPPAPNLIVPGERIGPWTLAMTVAQLERLVGPPRLCCEDIETDYVVALRDYCPAEVDIFFSRGNRPIHIRVAQITLFSRTAEGVGIGSTLGAALSTYGQPTARTQLGDDFAGYIRVVYDHIGLALRVNTVTETVVAISVFKPGTGRSIWRF